MAEAAHPVVTIDGPAGSGKGATGQRLALGLGWHFLDSGALYRTCAYVLERDGIAEDDAPEHLSTIDFRCVPKDGGDVASVFLDGEDVGAEIRTMECGRLASKLATRPEIRAALLKVQHALLRPPGLVADGRDMGTVVFPQAIVKIYLTADAKIRARRKYQQLKLAGNCVKLDSLYREILDRDFRDSTRLHAPLVVPDGAFELDTSALSLDEVTEALLEEITSHLG